MLLQADDKLVPEFLQALKENGQPHVADMLRKPGDLLQHLSRSSMHACMMMQIACHNLL